MNGMTDRIYLDANIFIWMREGGAGDEITHLLMRLPDVGWKADCYKTSELTLAETMVVPSREGAEDLIGWYNNVLGSSEGLEVGPVNRQVLEGAAILRARWRGLKLPDAIHIATAILFRCTYLLTGDERITGTYDFTHHRSGRWRAAHAVSIIRPDVPTLRNLAEGTQ